jgi:formylglycine-generating enzyme required for sulfatase activity
VEFPEGFWMGAYEVTQREWEAVMGGNPSSFSSAGPLAPVERVSYDDALAFCRRLTERERAAGRLSEAFEYTLPTEAQWEYACRGGSPSAYAWGGAFGLGLANVENDEGTPENRNAEAFRAAGMPVDTTMTVGSFAPNAWGLYDMHGNVWEWCLDWYRNSLPGGLAVNPAGPAEGTQRIIRGGAWLADARSARCAFRAASDPQARGSHLGFRVALVRTAPGGASG